MGEVTKIEWTGTYLSKPVMWKGEETTFIPGATFNLVIGCQKVSPACKYCYAEALDIRWNKGQHWGPNTDRKQMGENYWKQPLKWDKEAAAAGIMRKVFCSSLADWCEDHPQLVQARARLIQLIRNTPNLIWLLLTKRPENILRFIPDDWKRQPPKNVWYGTTVESQDYTGRIEKLCKVPASLRFISCEPLLSGLDVKKYLGSAFFGPIFSDRLAINGGGKIHWVIAGGESGKAKDIRPSHPKWFTDLRDQCRNAVVPFLFKQWGEWSPGSSEEFYSEDKPLMCVKPNGELSWWAGDSDTTINHSENYEEGDYPVERVGKHKSGRLLEGKEYNEMPDTFYKEKLHQPTNDKKEEIG